MSLFDYLDELESMAQSAADHDAAPEEADEIGIQRWQKLFNCSYSEAAKKLQEHRAGICRNPVSDAHWELVRADKEAQGYDKEAYEYSCQLLVSQQSRRDSDHRIAATNAVSTSTYLFKLEGPLHSISAIRAAGCLSDNDDGVSKLIACVDDSGLPANFCIIEATTKHNILVWLSSEKSPFQPTFVRYSKADKALSSASHCPTLGVDTTLPQHRLTSSAALPSPGQDEYPVWYFFYGTLADPAVLRGLFWMGDDAEPPIKYRPAKIVGGTLTTWGGKYRALVDATTEDSTVEGSAFLVLTKDQEDALRCYETDKYEVVRCKMEMLDSDGTTVRGLTFRFKG
ncbi:hypothetical protein B0T25DRAFT_544246 [Lasiosphaeria hispida]|uniref:Putative gamma-glutamylcyclotransferase n=1 Tax=Lasiosphaeria hispida TaxID=260671 RepID=A0AAJ0HIP7_9PEZI|nr:hypothetical protein B0T25DRAFT_544246 [Lasiosphaeria hispida]